MTSIGTVTQVCIKFRTKKKPHKKHGYNAGRRTKFAPVKSLDSSEFSSEFSDLKTLSSNVKVNPVIS